MSKKDQTGRPTKQGKETLTAGRIIKMRLPTETDKPNPFSTDTSKPDGQEPVTPNGNPQDTSAPGDTAKPPEPKR